MIDIKSEDEKVTSSGGLISSSTITSEHLQRTLSAPKLPPITIVSNPIEFRTPTVPFEGKETTATSLYLNQSESISPNSTHAIAIQTPRTPDVREITISPVQAEPQLSTNFFNSNGYMAPSLSSEHPSVPLLTVSPKPHAESTSPPGLVVPQTLPVSSRLPTEDHTRPRVFRFIEANNPYTSPFIGYYLTFLVMCMIIGFGLGETYYVIITSNQWLEYSALVVGMLFFVISGAPSMG